MRLKGSYRQSILILNKLDALMAKIPLTQPKDEATMGPNNVSYYVRSISISLYDDQLKMASTNLLVIDYAF